MRHLLQAGLLLLVLSGMAAAQDTMRFRGMDRNNDGVITRAEWRGNDRSFRNHDWNGDGVLAGEREFGMKLTKLPAWASHTNWA